MGPELRRDAIIASIPTGYRPWLHLAGTVGGGVVTLIVAAMFIHDVTPVELLTIPAMLVFSNALEWWIHKHPLHHRTRMMEILYDLHTKRHHMAYDYDTMPMESYRELRLVLMPAVGLWALVVAISPLAALCGWILSANCGWLVLLMASLYMVAYELTHLAYHLPSGHPIGDSRIVAWLREHHRRHHDARLMRRWNFNVTVPLFDVLMGTHLSDAEMARLSSKPAPGPDALSTEAGDA